MYSFGVSGIVTIKSPINDLCAFTGNIVVEISSFVSLIVSQNDVFLKYPLIINYY